MPWRQRLHWPQPAWISTLTRSPIANSSTSGPNAATLPIYSWPGVKSLLKGSPPWMLAGEPEWMISRSVAQIATASMRTRASARPGTGVGLSRRKSSSGPPRTQAFICPGTGNWGDVLTPTGLYIATQPQLLAISMRKAFVTVLGAAAIGFLAVATAQAQSTPLQPAAG